MKTIEITFRNGSSEFTRTVQTSAQLDKSKVLGTTLSDLFRLVSLQAKGMTKLFNMSEPFDIIVKTEGLTIDTTKISDVFKTKFKLNKTAKRKKAFAQTVWTVIEFATTKTKVITYENLEKALERDVIQEELAV